MRVCVSVFARICVRAPVCARICVRAQLWHKRVRAQDRQRLHFGLRLNAIQNIKKCKQRVNTTGEVLHCEDKLVAAGIELGTFRIQTENHATKPSSPLKFVLNFIEM